jgi:hypothetical protein
LVLSGSKDELIWQYQPLGVYSSHSLYSIINFRGVLPVYILAVHTCCMENMGSSEGTFLHVVNVTG